MRKIEFHWRLWLLAAVLAGGGLLPGCGNSFYLSESDAAAYQANLWTASQANQLLAGVQGQTISLQFDSAQPVPHLTATNMGDVLRSVPSLWVLDFTHQINLDRLAAQLPQQVDPWLSEAFSGLLQAGGGAVSLQRVDSTYVDILSAPVLSYDATRQSVGFSLAVRVRISAALLANGDLYHVQVQLENLRLQGQMLLANPFVDAAMLRLQLNPHVESVTISPDGLPDALKVGIRSALSGQLVPIDKSRTLVFDNFSLFPLRLVASQPGVTLAAGYLPRPRSAEPTIDIVARGQDGKLYHARRKAGVWQDFAALTLPASIGSDPALVASGADQQELAAVSTSGELFYAAWREESWGSVFRSAMPHSGQRPGGYAIARPALLATAPGQVEIFAVGTDGLLWHIRRRNGQWMAPTQVPLTAYVQPAQPPLRDPVAVQAGNKVILLFVDRRNLLYGTAFDLETSNWTWTLMLTLGGSHVNFAPTAVSCDSGRVDYVYAGDGGHPYHRVLTALRSRVRAGFQGSGFDVGDETAVGGTLNESPVLACSGFQQLELFGRGTDNAPYQNRFLGTASPQGLIRGQQIQGGWQGWQKLSDRFFGTPPSDLATLFAGVRVSEATLGSTWSGEVVLVARSNGNGAQPLLFNSYDSRRFGRANWSAVNWRGFQAVGTTSFVGNPALALSDRVVQIGLAASTDAGDQLGLKSYSAAGIPTFGSLTSAPVQLAVAPAVIFSGPGAVDVFSVHSNGGLVHTSARNYQQFVDFQLGRPSNSSLLGISAASGGPGLIDVVTVSQDRSLHHWRMFNGSWQCSTAMLGATPGESVPCPITIPGAVDSAPVLVSTGAGQMELFAIGGDHKLYRWRFVNGAWTGWHQVSSDFRLRPSLFGPSVASSWGDGTVDLVVASEEGAMYHARAVPALTSLSVIVPAAPGDAPELVFSRIGGNTTDVPNLVALGSQHLRLFAIGTDGYLYENIAAPSRERRLWTLRDLQLGLNLRWPGFQPLTSAPVRVGGTARLGEQFIEILAIDDQGWPYLNRLSGEMWRGFSVVPMQPRNQQPFRPVLAVP
jgi:hypothetical protein